MAVYAAAAMTLRKKIIISGLRKSGATTPESAKALSETGIVNPNHFQQYTDSLVQMGVLHKTKDGKYWIDKK